MNAPRPFGAGRILYKILANFFPLWYTKIALQVNNEIVWVQWHSRILIFRTISDL